VRVSAPTVSCLRSQNPLLAPLILSDFPVSTHNHAANVSVNSISAVTMQHPQKRRRKNDEMSKHTSVFRQCAEVSHTGPASVDIQLIEKLKNQIERLKVDIETMGRRLEHLERKDEISSARLLMLESKSGISYRFRASARQKDDAYVCCVANCHFRSRKSARLHSHWRVSSSPEHQLMASLWDKRYCYPCGKWFDSTKAFYSHEAKHDISASPRSVDLDLQKILGSYRGLDERDILREDLEEDMDGLVQECGSVSSGNSPPVTTPVGHAAAMVRPECVAIAPSLSSRCDLQYARELDGGDRHTPVHTQKSTLSQLSAPEQRDSNFHSQATQLPLPASADTNVQGEKYLPVQPMWQSGDGWPTQDTQAPSCPASGNANVQGEEYLPAQPIWQSGDWPTQDTQASSCPTLGNANVQGEEYLPVQPIWQSGDWPTQDTQASSCPTSGNANVQGKGAYSVQATLQNIEDWSTQVSPDSASKDANHQGQNSHAPFQGKEDLTPQLVQLQQRPANPHALTLDEHASRAKAATSTSYGAAMPCVGCNQYQALMSSIAKFLHTREVRCHNRVGCWDGEGSLVSVVAAYSRMI
jgi:hypothetical protein